MLLTDDSAGGGNALGEAVGVAVEAGIELDAPPVDGA